MCGLNISNASQAQWYMPAVLTLRMQKEEAQGFKAKLSYMKLCFKNSNNKEIRAIPYSVSCRAGSSLNWAEKVTRLVECLSGIHKTLFHPQCCVKPSKMADACNPSI